MSGVTELRQWPTKFPCSQFVCRPLPSLIVLLSDLQEHRMKRVETKVKARMETQDEDTGGGHDNDTNGAESIPSLAFAVPSISWWAVQSQAMIAFVLDHDSGLCR